MKNNQNNDFIFSVDSKFEDRTANSETQDIYLAERSGFIEGVIFHKLAKNSVSYVCIMGTTYIGFIQTRGLG